MKTYTISNTRVFRGIKVNFRPYAHVEVGAYGPDKKVSNVGIGHRFRIHNSGLLSKVNVILTKDKKTKLIVPPKKAIEDNRALVLVDIDPGQSGTCQWVSGVTMSVCPNRNKRYELDEICSWPICELCGDQLNRQENCFMHQDAGEIDAELNIEDFSSAEVSSGKIEMIAEGFKKFAGAQYPVKLLVLHPDSKFKIVRTGSVADGTSELFISWDGNFLDLKKNNQAYKEMPEVIQTSEAEMQCA